jgi:hypothetical protein
LPAVGVMVLKPVSVGLSLVVRVLVTVIGVAVPPGAVGEGVMMEVITWVVGVRVGAVVVWVVAWVVAGVLEGGSDVGEGDEGGGEEAGGRDEGRVTGVDEGGLGVGEVMAVPLLAMATAERERKKWTATRTIRLLLEEYTVARDECVCGSASEKCDCTRLLVPGMRQARARRQSKEGRGRRW